MLKCTRACVDSSKKLCIGTFKSPVQGFFFDSSLTENQRRSRVKLSLACSRFGSHTQNNSAIASGERRGGRSFANMSHPGNATLSSGDGLGPGDEIIKQFSSILSSMRETMNVENKNQSLLWLGSGSQSRKQLLGELLDPLGVEFRTMSADIDEKAIRVEDPRELVVQLAHAKADAILWRMEDEGVEKKGFLLTCDQVVVHEDTILEKPETEEEARRFIDGYGRSPASTVGSVVCTSLESGERVETVDVAQVRGVLGLVLHVDNTESKQKPVTMILQILFRPIPKEAVDALVEEGEIFWCAGGLMVEHPLVVPHVVDMQGGIDSVMGLKKESVVKLVIQAALK